MNRQSFYLIRLLREGLTNQHINSTLKELQGDSANPIHIDGFHVDEKEIVMLVSAWGWEPETEGGVIKRRKPKRDPASGEQL